MSETLDGALAEIFGQEQEEVDDLQEEVPAGETEAVLPEDMQGLASRAYELFQEAQQAQQQGNWQEYGERLDQLNEVLNQLNNLSQEAVQ